MIDLFNTISMLNDSYFKCKLGLKNSLTAQITPFRAKKDASDITDLRMVAAVGLMAALGGDWIDSQDSNNWC
jgi:hypothetical protein